MTPDLRTLSLGAGVQSTTLLLLAVEGALPKPDAAIFADTGWEPAAVYAQVDRLEAVAREAGIDFYRVANGNIRDDIVTPGRRFAAIPYHITHEDGTPGLGRRQCTSEYKLTPINRKVRELLGAKPPDFRRVPKGRVCEQWIGFSTDEIGRVSDKQGLQYLQARYPLLELNMSRKDCQRWLAARGWGDTAKSACIGCPFHGNRAWRDLRDNRPDEWADAVAFDNEIRNGAAPGPRGGTLRGQAYLHRSRKPLAIAPIDRVTRREHQENQTDIFDHIAELDDPDGCSPYGCRSGLPAGSESA